MDQVRDFMQKQRKYEPSPPFPRDQSASSAFMEWEARENRDAPLDLIPLLGEVETERAWFPNILNTLNPKHPKQLELYTLNLRSELEHVFSPWRGVHFR